MGNHERCIAPKEHNASAFTLATRRLDADVSHRIVFSEPDVILRRVGDYGMEALDPT